MLAAYLASCYFLSHITVLPYLQLTLSLHDALPICAMDMALKDASLEPEEISYINAHGTSTDMNDRLETKAIKEVFGDHAYKLAVSSTKSMTGHLLGAAGGVESVISVKTIAEGIIPATINYETSDPDCDLDYVPNEARKQDVNAVLSNSFGFGGHNACLVFKKYVEN